MTKRSQKAGKEPLKYHFWKVILPYLKPFRSSLFFSALLSIICGLCVSTQPLIIKYIVDTGIEKQPFRGYVPQSAAAQIQFILFCVAVYLIISVARIMSYRYSYLLQLRAQKGCMMNLRSVLFSHIQHLCMRFFDKTPSGEIFNYILGSPMGNIETYLSGVTLGVPYQAVSLIVSLTALFTYDWKMTVVLFLTSCAMAGMNFLSRKKVRRASREFISAERAASTFITDMLHGIDTVKTYSIEDDVTDQSVAYLDNPQAEEHQAEHGERPRQRQARICAVSRHCRHLHRGRHRLHHAGHVRGYALCLPFQYVHDLRHAQLMAVPCLHAEHRRGLCG